MLDKTSSAYERSHATASVALAEGKSFDSVIQMLKAAGFSDEDALEIATDAQEVQQVHAAKPSSGIAVFLGSIIFLAGVVVGLGNMSGFFPTFPYLGFIIMGVGALFVAGGRGTRF